MYVVRFLGIMMKANLKPGRKQEQVSPRIKEESLLCLPSTLWPIQCLMQGVLLLIKVKLRFSWEINLKQV